MRGVFGHEERIVSKRFSGRKQMTTPEQSQENRLLAFADIFVEAKWE
jgi:hypothetical protein